MALFRANTSISFKLNITQLACPKRFYGAPMVYPHTRTHAYPIKFPQPKKRVISPIPPAKDGLTPEVFLKKIGRNCAQYATKFTTWEDFMGCRSLEMKKRDIPCKDRKWITKHMWKYREGRLDHWRWQFPEVSEW